MEIQIVKHWRSEKLGEANQEKYARYTERVNEPGFNWFQSWPITTHLSAEGGFYFVRHILLFFTIYILFLILYSPPGNINFTHFKKKNGQVFQAGSLGYQNPPYTI